MDMPTAEAIQWVEVTTPKVPVISGSVVKFNTILSLPLFAIGWVQISRGSRASRRPSPRRWKPRTTRRKEEQTSEHQSLMRIPHAAFRLNKQKTTKKAHE